MRDDSGQMFLLTAVVLIAAFLALTVVVLRGHQAASEVSRETPGTVMDHVAVVRDGVRQLVARLEQQTTFSQAEVDGGLQALVQMQASDGLAMTFSAGGCGPGPGNIQGSFTLSDATTRVTEQFAVSYTKDCT